MKPLTSLEVPLAGPKPIFSPEFIVENNAKDKFIDLVLVLSRIGFLSGTLGLLWVKWEWIAVVQLVVGLSHFAGVPLWKFWSPKKLHMIGFLLAVFSLDLLAHNWAYMMASSICLFISAMLSGKRSETIFEGRAKFEIKEDLAAAIILVIADILLVVPVVVNFILGKNYWALGWCIWFGICSFPMIFASWGLCYGFAQKWLVRSAFHFLPLLGTSLGAFFLTRTDGWMVIFIYIAPMMFWIISATAAKSKVDTPVEKAVVKSLAADLPMFLMIVIICLTIIFLVVVWEKPIMEVQTVYPDELKSVATDIKGIIDGPVKEFYQFSSEPLFKAMTMPIQKQIETSKARFLLSAQSYYWLLKELSGNGQKTTLFVDLSGITGFIWAIIALLLIPFSLGTLKVFSNITRSVAYWGLLSSSCLAMIFFSFIASCPSYWVMRGLFSDQVHPYKILSGGWLILCFAIPIMALSTILVIAKKPPKRVGMTRRRGSEEVMAQQFLKNLLNVPVLLMIVGLAVIIISSQISNFGLTAHGRVERSTKGMPEWVTSDMLKKDMAWESSTKILSRNVFNVVWGAEVVSELFKEVPVVGEYLSNATNWVINKAEPVIDRVASVIVDGIVKPLANKTDIFEIGLNLNVLDARLDALEKSFLSKFQGSFSVNLNEIKWLVFSIALVGLILVVILSLFFEISSLQSVLLGLITSSGSSLLMSIWNMRSLLNTYSLSFTFELTGAVQLLVAGVAILGVSLLLSQIMADDYGVEPVIKDRAVVMRNTNLGYRGETAVPSNEDP